ncbi:MAG: membrane protein insertion efficiency factor YidD [bacterium]
MTIKSIPEIVCCSLAALIILLYPTTGIAGESPGQGMPSDHHVARTAQPRGTGPFSWMIRLYQRHISPINGGRCPMYPSCSRFAVQAVEEEGAKGLLMTFDRLLRCGRDLEGYPLIFHGGRVLRHDPVGAIPGCTTHESAE